VICSRHVVTGNNLTIHRYGDEEHLRLRGTLV
jgi:hypothetical protein